MQQCNTAAHLRCTLFACPSAAGACYIRGGEAPAKLILRDVVEMCKGVQHPTRGLFLRAYLVQVGFVGTAWHCLALLAHCMQPFGPRRLGAAASVHCKWRVAASLDSTACSTASSTWPRLGAAASSNHTCLLPRQLSSARVASAAVLQVMRGLLPDTGSKFEGEGAPHCFFGWMMQNAMNG